MSKDNSSKHHGTGGMGEDTSSKPKNKLSKQDATVDLPPCIAFLARVLHDPAFDHGMGVVIMLNMVAIILETDHAAEHEGNLVWVDNLGWGILVIFIIELLARLLVLRMSFFKDHWNTFDFVIVTVDSLFSFLGLVLGNVFPVSTLRVFRLCKLARVSKVFRVFPELRIMMAGLLGSIRSIFWGTVLLTFVLLVWAIVAVQFIHPLNQELAAKGGLDGCERCPRAYSSVMQSTLTFSQQIVAGDSWGTATIPLIEAYPVTALYFLGVFLSIGFAVMNLILGVVVNVAQTEHARLKEEIEAEKAMARMEASNDLRSICEDMDGDGSGELSMEELLGGFDERPEFRSAISELDISKEDIMIAFETMDADKSGSVSYDEFLNKIYKMKDTDAQFLMEQVKFHILHVKELILNKIVAEEESLKTSERCSLEKLDRNIQLHFATLEETMQQHLAIPPKCLDSMQDKEPKQEQKPSLLQITPKEIPLQEGIFLKQAGASDEVKSQQEGTLIRPAGASDCAPRMAEGRSIKYGRTVCSKCQQPVFEDAHTIRDVLDAIL